MQNEFVPAKSSQIHWIDQLVYVPAAVTCCGILPVAALFSGKTDFWGLSLTTCVLIQYLGQLRKAEGRLRGMNTTQASNLVENLGK
jgi:hypothetical protein